MPETMHPTHDARIFVVVTRRPFRSLRVNNATRLGARVGLGVSSPRRVRGGDRRVPRVRGFVGSMARVNGVGDQAGFATDLLPELMGGLYCYVFQITTSADMSAKYADVLVFRLPLILVLIFIVQFLLPS